MTKKELALKYGISTSTLRKLLNNDFYSQLSELGYHPQQRLLAPCVVRKFIELYGEPLNENEL